MEALAYYDGKIGTPEELMVPFNDRVHFFGDGVYDATVGANGKVYLMQDHLDRFYTSAKALDIHIPMPKEELGKLLTEGKGKRVYATDDPDQAIVYFKDEAMAFHGLKRGRILGKGEVNNAISEQFFKMLEENQYKILFGGKFLRGVLL